jgi:hypothetical protein
MTLGGPWATLTVGIDAQLRRENGKVVDEVGDSKNVLRKATNGALSGTRLLQYLMPWGDAVFNQAQASDLANDVADACRSNEGTALCDHLMRLQPLVERLSNETHKYLWFVGD